VDIITYNIHQSGRPLLDICRKTRLLLGCPGEPGERRATIEQKALRYATGLPNVRVGLLHECHIKLALFYNSKPSTPFAAILGSCNLGLGHYNELSVELRSRAELAHAEAIFSRLWLTALKIKPLDLQKVAAALAVQVFEV
jgi:hypothetical protein